MILRQFLHTEPVVTVSDLLGCGGRSAGAGAEYVLHSDAGVHPLFRGVRDGDRLELGSLRLEVLHLAPAPVAAHA